MGFIEKPDECVSNTIPRPRVEIFWSRKLIET